MSENELLSNAINAANLSLVVFFVSLFQRTM